MVTDPAEVYRLIDEEGMTFEAAMLRVQRPAIRQVQVGQRVRSGSRVISHTSEAVVLLAESSAACGAGLASLAALLALDEVQ